MARNRVVKFTQTPTGLWVGKLKTRGGVLPIRPHRRFQDVIEEGVAYLCKLNKLSNNEGFIASEVTAIEDNPLFYYYTDSSKLGVFVSIYINGDEEAALGVFYDRRTDTVSPKVSNYTSSMRDSLIKTYKVSDEDIERYRRITAKRYLANLEY